MATFGSKHPARHNPLDDEEEELSEPLLTIPHAELAARFQRLLVGQPGVAPKILPYVQMYQAGLNPPGRPAGVFLLLGPTGTGKTRTVEALAEALHGKSSTMLRIDCGEFQLDHEVAKLIGAPPGYLGHRETQPLLSQSRLNAQTSDACDLTILLFDEIEKAAPSMMRLLLGMLDRGQMRMGDNNTVSFEKTVVFMTSNLGADAMQKAIRPRLGFASFASTHEPHEVGKSAKRRLESIGVHAARRKFSPEFMNRIDAILTYAPLDEGAIEQILQMQIDALQNHIRTRLGDSAFEIRVTQRLRKHLLEHGISQEYGARELKRTIQRYVLQPLSTVVVDGRAVPGSTVVMDWKGNEKVLIRVQSPPPQPLAA